MWCDQSLGSVSLLIGKSFAMTSSSMFGFFMLYYLPALQRAVQGKSRIVVGIRRVSGGKKWSRQLVMLPTEVRQLPAEDPRPTAQWDVRREASL